MSMSLCLLGGDIDKKLRWVWFYVGFKREREREVKEFSWEAKKNLVFGWTESESTIPVSANTVKPYGGQGVCVRVYVVIWWRYTNEIGARVGE